jgi:2-polyprenyl-6-hydroxyphenyl methylase / 3-demethylubiquinone-9 3-methyltransferase
VLLTRSTSPRRRSRPPVRPRNDLRQYDDLVDEWTRPDGAFAALHWLATSRRAVVPDAATTGEVLVDIGCGAGLTSDPASSHVHIGIDLVESSLRLAAARGVQAVRADAANIPLASSSADVVVAGEILEHVTDLPAVVGEICRVLRPGGHVVIDTINDSRLARFALVTVAERLPGGPPRGIHDPRLFVRPDHLQRLFAAHGVELRIWGLRPSALDYARFLADRRRPVRMLTTRSPALVYQGVGTKAPAVTP